MVWIATKIFEVSSKATSPKSQFSRNDGTLKSLTPCHCEEQLPKQVTKQSIIKNKKGIRVYNS